MTVAALFGRLAWRKVVAESLLYIIVSIYWYSSPAGGFYISGMTWG